MNKRGRLHWSITLLSLGLLLCGLSSCRKKDEAYKNGGVQYAIAQDNNVYFLYEQEKGIRKYQQYEFMRGNVYERDFDYQIQLLITYSLEEKSVSAVEVLSYEQNHEESVGLEIEQLYELANYNTHFNTRNLIDIEHLDLPEIFNGKGAVRRYYDGAQVYYLKSNDECYAFKTPSDLYILNRPGIDELRARNIDYDLENDCIYFTGLQIAGRPTLFNLVKWDYLDGNTKVIIVDEDIIYDAALEAVDQHIASKE